MKLNRQKLIENVDQALKTQQSIEDQYDELLKEKQKEHLEAWFQHNSKYWYDFIARLQDKLKNRQPIISGDMPDRYSPRSTEQVFYNGYRPTQGNYTREDQFWIEAIGPRPTARVRELKALKGFLESVDDELVSQTALERVGFRNLYSLFLLGESQIVS